MNMEYLVLMGGIYHLGWALFDSSWPILFDWKRTLAPLDDFNRSLLYIISRLLVVLYLALAYLSFFQTSELVNTGLGKTILVFVSIYWIVRVIMQIQYFGIFNKANELNIKIAESNIPSPLKKLSNQWIANLFLPYFLLGIALHLIPVLDSTS